MNPNEIVTVSLRRDHYRSMPLRPRRILAHYIARWNDHGDLIFSVPRRVMVDVSRAIVEARV